MSDLRVLGSALFARSNGGENGTLWYYDSLASVFLPLGPKKLAEELDRTVEELYRQSGQQRPHRVTLERSNGTSFATEDHSAQG